MTELFLDIKDDGIFRVLGRSSREAERDLQEAVDDIADRIEEYAGILAPRGKTGELQKHPVDREDIRGIVTTVPAFGGGTLVRGPRNFIAASPLLPGSTVLHVELTVAEIPEHAIWVHRGTGVFGPYKSPIVPVSSPKLVFYIDNRKFVLPSVKGQPAQPFLEQAFTLVQHTYVDLRVEQLRLEIASMFR